MNAEFKRIAMKDKKAFLSDQCREIEENIRMGKTRALYKKSRDTKGNFHAKMGTIKDRNSMDLMATHCSVLAWRIPGMGEPVGLPSMGLHRVEHD